MDDIEKLISNLPRPSPSEALDARIGQLLDTQLFDAQLAARPRRREETRSRIQWSAALVACTACAGFIGFLLGRQSAPAIATSEPVVELSATSETPGERITEAAKVTVQLPQDEGLARFVLPPRQLEGLFGSGPLEERTDSPILQ